MFYKLTFFNIDVILILPEMGLLAAINYCDNENTTS